MAFETITFTTPPNWGQYVTGVGTLEYYYRTILGKVVYTTLLANKISYVENENAFKWASESVNASAFNSRGDTQQGQRTSSTPATMAVIPNALPGGYTP